jgi:hypothetical protein
MAIQNQQELDLEKQIVDYKTHSELQRLNLEAAFSYVAEGTKSAFLLNGAAGIGLMTFIGAQRSGNWPALVLRCPLVLFAAGAALAVLTLGIAYVSQAYFAEMNMQRQQTSSSAERLRYVGIGTFVGSVLCFVVGLALAAFKL